MPTALRSPQLPPLPQAQSRETRLTLDRLVPPRLPLRDPPVPNLALLLLLRRKSSNHGPLPRLPVPLIRIPPPSPPQQRQLRLIVIIPERIVPLRLLGLVRRLRFVGILLLRLRRVPRLVVPLLLVEGVVAGTLRKMAVGRLGRRVDGVDGVVLELESDVPACLRATRVRTGRRRDVAWSWGGRRGEGRF